MSVAISGAARSSPNPHVATLMRATKLPSWFATSEDALLTTRDLILTHILYRAGPMPMRGASPARLGAGYFPWAGMPDGGFLGLLRGLQGTTI
jgi:hypothetical protein